MIEALKSEDIINKVGGRFKLTALIQRRLAEILQGSRPLVEQKPGQTLLELVIEEIDQDKIAIDYDRSDIVPPEGYVSPLELKAQREAEEAKAADEARAQAAAMLGAADEEEAPAAE